MSEEQTNIIDRMCWKRRIMKKSIPGQDEGCSHLEISGFAETMWIHMDSSVLSKLD